MTPIAIDFISYQVNFMTMTRIVKFCPKITKPFFIWEKVQARNMCKIFGRYQIKMAIVNSARFSNFDLLDVTNGSSLVQSFLELHHNSFYNCVFTSYLEKNVYCRSMSSCTYSRTSDCFIKSRENTNVEK